MDTSIDLQYTLNSVRAWLPKELCNEPFDILVVMRADSSKGGQDWVYCRLTNGSEFTLRGSTNFLSTCRRLDNAKQISLDKRVEGKKTIGFRVIASTTINLDVDEYRRKDFVVINPGVAEANTPTRIPLNHSTHKPQSQPEPTRNRLAQVIDDWVDAERADWF